MALRVDRAAGAPPLRNTAAGTPLPLGEPIVQASDGDVLATDDRKVVPFETLLARLHRLCQKLDDPAAASKEPKPEKPRDRADGTRRDRPDKPRPGSGPLLRYGVRGEPVKKLQQRLEELGIDPGPIDGIFGPRTRDAVRAYQRREKIAVDGIVGPQTWGRLGIHVRGKVERPNPGASLDIGRAGDMATVQGFRMTPGTARAFVAMAREASRDGLTLRINSAYRSDAEQAVLWRQALGKYGSAAAARKWVAPPGHSNHRTGRALDIHTTDAIYAWLRRNGGRFGFGQPMSWEPWHWEHNS